MLKEIVFVGGTILLAGNSWFLVYLKFAEEDNQQVRLTAIRSQIIGASAMIISILLWLLAAVA